MQIPTAAVVAFLGLCLFGLSLVLMRMGSDRRMKERVAGAAGRVLTTEQVTKAVEASPSIRLATGPRRPWLDRIFRAFCFYQDVRAAYTYPIPLIVAIGVSVGLFIFIRFQALMPAYASAGLGAIAAFLIIRTICKSQFNKYRDALFKQVPDAMGLVVRAIRAGLPMSEALRSISREMPSPTKDEFSKIVGDVAIGRPVDEAIMRLHERSQLTEFAFLAVTLGMQQQTGGSLAETLDNLADIVRKRVQAAERAKALAAEARMQAAILMVLPFIAALGMSFIQPGYVESYTGNPTGIRMALIGLGLMALGSLTIRWLIYQAGQD